MCPSNRGNLTHCERYKICNGLWRSCFQPIGPAASARFIIYIITGSPANPDFFSCLALCAPLKELISGADIDLLRKESMMVLGGVYTSGGPHDFEHREAVAFLEAAAWSDVPGHIVGQRALS